MSIISNRMLGLGLRLAGKGTTFIAGALRKVLPAQVRPIGYLTRLVRKRTQGSVRGGPFQGMRYVERAIGSAYLPKLLGTYERELGLAIEEACARGPSLIVDVGAAEGYYAVGLALRNPRARVVAFESQPGGQAALRQMAELNRVGGRIEVRGRCVPAELGTLFNRGQDRGCHFDDSIAFLVCDAEGDEISLLDPRSVPGLRSVWILAETHDFVQPGITDELLKRFTPTHRIQQIWQTPRRSGEFPFRSLGTRILPRSYLHWAMSEWRPVPMCWLWMKPHVRG